MHILLIHQAFTTLDEAGGTRHAELARYLCSFGHQVTVIASPLSYLTGKTSPAKESDAFLKEQGITVLRTYTFPGWHRSFFQRVISFITFMFSAVIAGLRVKNVDVVWGTSPPLFQAASAWLLAKLKRLPLLFEVRDLWPAFAIQVGVLRNPFLIAPAEWFERFMYRQADIVLINSPGFMDHVTDRGARQVVVVPNGVDTHLFTPEADGSQIRLRYGLEDKFVVLYAGAHGLSNDLGIVLEAAAYLLPHTSIKIVLVGDGKEKPNLMRQATALNLSNVLFLPPFSKQEMPQVLAAADACLAILKPLPLYKTVYPNKVFDYLAAGKPILLAIDGVIRQVVEEAQAGIFVPPGNPQALAKAVLYLSENPQLCRQMGEKGRIAAVTHFERAQQAAQLNQILEKLTASSLSS